MVRILLICLCHVLSQKNEEGDVLVEGGSLSLLSESDDKIPTANLIKKALDAVDNPSSLVDEAKADVC